MKFEFEPPVFTTDIKVPLEELPQNTLDKGFDRHIYPMPTKKGAMRFVHFPSDGYYCCVWENPDLNIMPIMQSALKLDQEFLDKNRPLIPMGKTSKILIERDGDERMHPIGEDTDIEGIKGVRFDGNFIDFWIMRPIEGYYETHGLITHINAPDELSAFLIEASNLEPDPEILKDALTAFGKISEEFDWGNFSGISEIKIKAKPLNPLSQPTEIQQTIE